MAAKLIDWTTIGRDKFDQTIEGLLSTMHGPKGCRAVNGRGGDGGVDFIVDRDGHKHIFQLKYFTDSLTGRGRRAQIRKSFNSAIKNEKPNEWTLVVPCLLTQSEHQFVMSLGEGRDVSINVMQREAIDIALAANPSWDHFARRNNTLIEHAQLARMEEDVLSNGVADVDTRLRALGNLADSIDPYWGLDFGREGDFTVFSLRAKRSDSFEKSPVKAHVKTRFGPADEDLRRAFQRAVGYGTSDRVILPNHVVSAFHWEGPEFLKAMGEFGRLEFGPAESMSGPHAVSIRLMDETDRVIATHSGETAHLGQATQGYSMEAKIHGALTIKFLFPRDKTAKGEFNLDLDFSGVEPSALIRAVNAVEGLESAHHIQVEIEGKHLCTIETLVRKDEPLDPQLAKFRSIAEDLQLLQDHTNTYFPMPAEWTGIDRVYLRCLRLLIEGKCVALPNAGILNVNLHGTEAPDLREFLGGESRIVFMEQQDFGVKIFGHELKVGRTYVYSPAVSVENGLEALEAIDRGEGAEFRVRLKPGDGNKSFWAFIPDLRTDASINPLPVPWGLIDIPEPADVEFPSIAS